MNRESEDVLRLVYVCIYIHIWLHMRLSHHGEWQDYQRYWTQWPWPARPQHWSWLESSGNPDSSIHSIKNNSNFSFFNTEKSVKRVRSRVASASTSASMTWTLGPWHKVLCIVYHLKSCQNSPTWCGIQGTQRTEPCHCYAKALSAWLGPPCPELFGLAYTFWREIPVKKSAFPIQYDLK